MEDATYWKNKYGQEVERCSRVTQRSYERHTGPELAGRVIRAIKELQDAVMTIPCDNSARERVLSASRILAGDISMENPVTVEHLRQSREIVQDYLSRPSVYGPDARQLQAIKALKVYADQLAPKE